jgi:class 3 adenylate cyclase/tetratricopeptide (TPR) repeat protein
MKEAQMICRNCQAEISQRARFCSNCGWELDQDKKHDSSRSIEKPYTQAGHTSLNSTISPPIQIGSIQGERRIVTILFCDIKGSTALAEQYDPEEWADIMNEVFQQLIQPVHRYGGTVARLLGDAVLAFFGAPKSHEDDPQRAILAGLDIVSNIKRLNEKTGPGKDREIQVRVGINTGLVVVGEVDSGFRSEYTAIGDAVNLAARMEQTAQPGTVQVSEETYRLTADTFDFEPLGQFEVKGKSRPVNAYRVSGLSEKREFNEGKFSFRAPLIGRDSELKRIREAISLAKLGRGQIVCLVGDAGIGKSRLIREVKLEWFTKQGNQLNATNKSLLEIDAESWLETRSISYTTHLPYGTFSQLVRNLFGISPGDTPESIREKITSECFNNVSEENYRRVIRAFEVLLGFDIGSGETKLEGEAFKRELFEAMTLTLHGRSMNNPNILVFDDLHWADPASIDLLVHLFKLVEEVPILFLLAFRVDREAPAWKIKQEADRDFPHRYSEISLKPLTQQESQQLVDNLLSFTKLPARLQHAVLDKTEGNPFFMEQIIHSLVEIGVLEKEDQVGNNGDSKTWKTVKTIDDITIPDTVQALIQARIDRLSEETRQTLQKAAVIGRSFYYRVLKEISKDDSSYENSLIKLEKFGLIQEAARQPEVEYHFSHSLTQETAYRSILRKRRREFHLYTGEAIEKLFPDQLEEYAPLLAYHFHEAGDKRALSYFHIAGDLAYRLYAMTEAIAHYSHALEIARGKGDKAVLEHLYIRRGRALELNTQYERAMDNFIEMEEDAKRLNDPPLILSALLARAALHSAPSSIANPDTARLLLDKALSLAKEMGDRAAEARILWNLSLVAIRYDDFREGIEYGQQALSLARELGLQELAAFTLNDLGWAYIPLGDMEKTRYVLNEARHIWKELDNKPMLVDSFATSSYVSFLEGKFDQTLAESKEGLIISKEINNLWGQAYSQICIGWIYFERGQPDKAIRSMQECLRLSKQAGFLVPLITLNFELSAIFASLGAVKKAREHLRISRDQGFSLPHWEQQWVNTYGARTLLLMGELEEAESLLGDFEKTKEIPVVHIFTAVVRLEIARVENDPSRVLELANIILETSKETGIHLFTNQTLFYKGEALLRIGNMDEARKILENLISKLEELGARRLLWQALIAQAEIEARTGSLEKAIEHQQKAGDIIYYIADRAGAIQPETGEDLRASFLNLPEVKAALSFQVGNYR